ncbi:MAG: DegT/DnrJ/EryC1/StrS family aminotransferase [Culicoidibacterales bacterium]
MMERKQLKRYLEKHKHKAGERIFLASPHMGGKEIDYVNEAFETNWIAPLGPHVLHFEQELAEMVGIKAAAAASSGTAAIHLALKVLGIQPGDEIFCSTFTFAATVNPIIYEQAIPVFIDSDYQSWNMCPKALQKAFDAAEIKGKLPKAVIVVNLYGQSADYDQLLAICNQYQVPIIEDAAESLGATYKGKATGTIGELGIFSFNGNKIITASNGGMLVSNNIDYIEKSIFLSTQAREDARHYEHKEIGYNYRMSNVSAGIGRGQLHVLKSRVQKKKAIFEKYKKDLSTISALEMMPICEYGESNYWLSPIIIHDTAIDPNTIIDALEAENIESRPLWKPMHLQPVFQQYELFTVHPETSVAEDLFLRGVCLPSDTKMTTQQQNRIIDVIKGVFQ